MDSSARALADLARAYILRRYGDQSNPVRLVVCLGPGLELEGVSVELLPCTAAELGPSEMQANILEALEGGAKLAGPQLAEKAGYTYSGRFRLALSALVKSGQLVNHKPGYSLSE